ncbi:unnamed protein product [Urochloa humidicola]
MGRRAPPLLLALVLAATAAALPSSPAGGTGVSFTNPASTGSAVVCGLGKYAGAVDQPKLRRAYPTPNDGDGDGSFTPEAYPVKWDDPSPPHDYLAPHRSFFTPEAYPVKWDDPSPPRDDLAARRSSFTPEAYPVKWDDPSPPHDVLSARRSSFTPEAYPVKWSEPRQPPRASDVSQTASGRGGHDLHVEPGMLFLRKSLFPGTILPEGTKFAGDAAAPAPRSFLSKAAADAIPFGYEHLDTILRTFRIPRGSKKADQVAATLRTCEEPSPEPHTCATSRQAAATFAAAALGTSSAPPRAVVTVVRGDEGAAAAARYAVAPNGVALIGGGKAVVPCHPMPYPYLVHYCHRPAGVEALRVELTAAAGVSATAVAMCHVDTASWDGRYFQMLNATRGEGICHFMPRGYVLWVAA